MIFYKRHHLGRQLVKKIIDQNTTDERFEIYDLIKNENLSDEELLDSNQSYLGKLISGEFPDVTEKAFQFLKNSSYKVDSISVKLLQNVGIDVAIAFHLAINLDTMDFLTIEIQKGPARGQIVRIWPHESSLLLVEVGIGPDIVVDDVSKININRALPLAVTIAMQGVRLSSVIDHPILNESEAKIVAAKQIDGKTVIHTDYRGNLLPLAQMDISSFKVVPQEERERKAGRKPEQSPF